MQLNSKCSAPLYMPTINIYSAEQMQTIVQDVSTDTFGDKRLGQLSLSLSLTKYTYETYQSLCILSRLKFTARDIHKVKVQEMMALVAH